MAIPDNPRFTAQNIAEYSRRVRSLSMPDRVYEEIASYLNVEEGLVREWLFASETVTGADEEEKVVISWGKDYSKPQLLAIIDAGLPLSQLRPFLIARRYTVPTRTTKAQVMALLGTRRKDELAGFLDALRPRQKVTIKKGRTVRLDDILTEEDYLGRQLSEFPRGKHLRKKVDLVLALLGEVRQTPQSGIETDSFGRTGATLREIENGEIWPLRQGIGVGGDPFLNEMWFQIILKPKQDYWEIAVWYVRVYEAAELFHTTGWPERDQIDDNGEVRSLEDMEEILRRKMEYEEYLKAKRRKARAKRRGTKR